MRAEPQITTQTLQLSATRVRLTSSVSEGPPLLWCHSNSTGAVLLHELQRSVLGQSYRIMALDFPGHGESEPSRSPRADYSIPGLASLLREVVRALALPELVLVGHSLGGHVALEALPGLQGVLGLLLLSAPPLNLDSLADVYKPDPTGGLLFEAQLSSTQVSRFASCLLAPNADLTLQRAVELAVNRTDAAFRSSLGRSVGAGELADERAIARHSDVPIALVHGEEDPFIQRAFYAQVELKSPWRGGIFGIPGAGHSPHLTHAAAFRPLLSSFLDSCFHGR